MKTTLRILTILTLALFTSNLTNAQTITTFPYSEDFESFAACGTGCGASCVLTGAGNVWTNDVGDNLDWLIDEGGTSSSATGPSVDHNPGTGTGNYLYVETSCSGTGFPNYTANLLSPAIDLTGTNDIQFDFWYHMYGQSMGVMHVDLSSDMGATWTNDIVPAWTDNVDQWQNMVVSLGAYTGTVIVRLRFISGSNFYSDAAIDDVNIYDLLQNDAGISSFINPSFPTCAFNDSVQVELTNYGTDTLFSVNIDWLWNATPGTTVNWTGAIPPGMSEAVYLGSVPYMSGDALTAVTNMPNGVSEMPSGSGNDLTTITLSTGLSGTYTIGATGDYTDFTSAVADLDLYGLCGPVVFNVEDGVYNEQITLTEPLGMNATNTVTFQSLNADPSLAILTYAATTTADNFVVNVDGGDYYNFNNLGLASTGVTYGTVILIGNGATHNTWTNNIIAGDMNVSTTSTNMALVYSPTNSSLDSMNVFDSNTFNYGSYAFYYYGGSDTQLENGTVITNNTISDFYYRGLHMYYQNNMEIGSNVITPGSMYTGSIYRIYMVYADGALRVHNNELAGSEYGYGIYMSNCDALSTDVGYVYNNFVYVGNPLNTSTSYGLYMTSCNFQVITFNSVNIESNGTSSRPIYVTGGSNNRILNNIFSNEGPGFGMYYLSGVSESDHNDIYVPNGIPFYFGGNIADINTWQMATSFDMASDTLDPLFTASDDLHTCQDMSIDAGALPDAMVLMDIDGQVRDLNTPDIGADEFLGLANLSFGADTLWKCSNDALVIGGWEPTDDALSYLWNSTESTPSISVTGEGVYNVTVTTACGSTNTGTYVANIPDAVAGFDMIGSYLTAAMTNTSSGAIDSHVWDFGDGYTTTDMNPTHLYADTGMYIITLTVTGPCGVDVYTDTMYSSFVGLDDLSSFTSLDVFPNPTAGNLNIEMGQEFTNTTVQVVDVLGTIVSVETYENTDSIKMNIDGKPGVYIVEIKTDSGKGARIRVLKK